MTIIGLTGGIASGKSHVARFFEEAGIPVIHSDQLAREVVLPGTATLERIRQSFPDVFLRDGVLDRKALGKKIFSSEADRKLLESIVHPPIRELFHEKLRFLEGQASTVVYEVPLLFETGLDREMDLTVVVDVPEPMQVDRLVRRDRMTEEEAKKRIAVQMPREERLKRAHIVLPGDLPDSELRNWIRRITEMARKEDPGFLM